MRYDLAGSSYKTSPTATDTTGASATEPANCDDGDAMTTVVLCGYELAQSLDFDLDGDGTTVSSDGTFDDGDNAAPYFVIGDGGWEPVGDGTTAFTAIFDGNGNTISNLAIRRNLQHVGFFGRTGTGSRIYNVGIINAFVRYSGTSSNQINVGGLVGQQAGDAIIASYVSGSVAGGGGAIDTVGTLVGEQSTAGSIVASYASGNASGGGGCCDRVGGLVGFNDGSITASYASAHATGSVNEGHIVGGLVGQFHWNYHR